MTPDDAAGSRASTVQANVANDDFMVNDVIAMSHRAAMAKVAQILGGDTAGVSFSLRYQILHSLFQVG